MTGQVRVALEDDPYPPLTKDGLYQLIAMNRGPVGRVALQDVFGHDEKTGEKLNDLLDELTDEARIVSDTRGYVATKPWADIAYAVVGTPENGKRIPLHILNMPPGPGSTATLSWADFTRHNLKEGSRIVVGLNRGLQATELRARFIASGDRPFRLAGIFNQKAQNFIPLDKTIKADFKLAQQPAANDVPHHFLVELPPQFDIRNPVVAIVEDQTKDMHTGAALSWIVTRKHAIADSHPEDVLKEGEILNRQKINFDQREDLRELDFVTVDPLGSTDLDDAFFAQVEGDGYALYTAIADVPALVTYGSKVDREAYKRGSTFYLTGKHTAHMLPPILSTKKSSLIANADRPAIIVKQSLDWQGNLLDYKVFAGVIRSKEQLSYGQFYDRLEREDPRFKVIAAIHNIRRRRGLDPELNALLKESADQYATKSIVETLMVQTNSLIAQFLNAANIPFLSRNFEQAGEQKNGTGQRAYYASSHMGHAALGLKHYAHVTSPIRRYADIVNMRAVHKALGTKGLGISDKEIKNLDKIADHLNGRRRVERDVAHDLGKYHAIRDLTRLQSSPVRIVINEIGADYIEITLGQTGLRQRLTASALPANQWQIDGAKRQLVLLGESGELRRYNQHETLLGKIYGVDLAKAQWKIKLLPAEPGARPASVPGHKPS
ncbi:MAG: ribonuclease catalytic domain-containing protein [Micavibrio sp.]